MNENPIHVNIVQSSSDFYHFAIDMNQLLTPLFEISTLIKGKFQVQKAKKDGILSFRGKIWSQYILINDQSGREFFGEFHFKKDRLYIRSLHFRGVFCRGTIQIMPPYHTELVFKVSSMALKDFLLFFASQKKYRAQGNVDGEILVSGNTDQLQLKGSLSAYKGYINKLQFSNIFVNLTGQWPRVQLSNSTITKEDGLIFNILGQIDLNDRKNYVKQIKALTLTPLINNDLNKSEWTLKRITSKEHFGITEFKYLRQKGNEKNFQEDSSEMLRIERKLEF